MTFIALYAGRVKNKMWIMRVILFHYGVIKYIITIYLNFLKASLANPKYRDLVPEAHTIALDFIPPHVTFFFSGLDVSK